MTGQEHFGSYEVTGVVTAVELVNTLAVARAFGRRIQPDLTVDAIRRILQTDPTWPRLEDDDVSGFVFLATRLRSVFDALRRGDLDAAANQLNDLLATHPAYPHLAKDGDQWRLHHHPADAAAVPMATAICAEALARVVGAGAAGRVGTCDAPDCDRVFLDSSKNASRRFCSTTCQNRVKATAYRRRRAMTDGTTAPREGSGRTG